MCRAMRASIFAPVTLESTCCPTAQLRVGHTNPNPNQWVCAFERVLQVPCTLTFKDTLSGAAPSRRLHLVRLSATPRPARARARARRRSRTGDCGHAHTDTDTRARVSRFGLSCSAASTVKGGRSALRSRAPGARQMSHASQVSIQGTCAQAPEAWRQAGRRVSRCCIGHCESSTFFSLVPVLTIKAVTEISLSRKSHPPSSIDHRARGLSDHCRDAPSGSAWRAFGSRFSMRAQHRTINNH